MPPEPKPVTYEALATPVSASIATKPAFGTYILFGINVAVFIAMVASGISIINPETQHVLKWGADYGPYTLDGQYWRLITSMFLHFGIIHIAANMWCLWSLGRLAEKLLGPVSVVAIYLLTGIGADLLSLSWDPMRVSAGASGAIFGIAGALISILQFGNLGYPRENVRKLLGYVVRFAFINLIFGLRGHVDNMAHLGGLVTGLLIGFFLARTFNAPAEERSNQNRNVLAASAVLLLLIFVPVARAKRYAAELNETQTAFTKADYAAAAEHAKKYIAERPQDDYGYYYLGASYQKLGQLEDAEREYERGLAVNSGDQDMQIGLAEVCAAQGKWEKALSFFGKNREFISDDADALLLYATALVQIKNLPEAEEVLKKSIHADSKLIESHKLLSDVLLQEGKTQEAMEEKHIADSLQAKSPSGNDGDKK